MEKRKEDVYKKCPKCNANVLRNMRYCKECGYVFRDYV